MSKFEIFWYLLKILLDALPMIQISSFNYITVQYTIKANIPLGLRMLLDTLCSLNCMILLVQAVTLKSFKQKILFR